MENTEKRKHDEPGIHEQLSSGHQKMWTAWHARLNVGLKKAFDEYLNIEHDIDPLRALYILRTLVILHETSTFRGEADGNVIGTGVIADILLYLPVSLLKIIADLDSKLKHIIQRNYVLEKKRSGQVYACGNGKYGKLGDGDTSYHSVGVPLRIQELDNIRITQVSAGYCHTVMVSDQGHVYACGDGRFGQLGDENAYDHSVGVPLRMQGLDNIRITQVSAGYRHTVMLSDQGHVYACGDGEYGRLGDGNAFDHSVSVPLRMQGLDNIRITQVSAGEFHTVMVSDQGHVYACGNGRFGRLGDGNTSYHNVGLPLRMQELDNIRITQVSAGYCHTVMVSDQGHVYACGDGRFGQLGDENAYDHSVGVPLRMQGLDNIRITQVSAGYRHTVMLSDQGHVYACGDGEYGRLGDGNAFDHSVSVPLRMQGLDNIRITQVSADYHHTVMLSDQGHVYACGNGEYGKLGDGDTSDHNVDVPLRMQGLDNDDIRIIQVSADCRHTVMVSAIFGKSGDSYPRVDRCIMCSNHARIACGACGNIDNSNNNNNMHPNTPQYCGNTCRQNHWDLVHHMLCGAQLK